MEGARLARAEDVPAIQVVLSALRERLQGVRGGPEVLALVPGEAVDPSSLLEALSGPQGFCLVGTVDEVVVGLAILRRQSSAYVLSCYVLEGARGVGVGECLVHAATEIARAEGVNRLDALALPGDRSMKQLYERAEMKARLLVLSKPLGLRSP